MKVARVVFVYNTQTTFIKWDEDILSERYQLKSIYLKRKHEIVNPKLVSAVARADVVVSWFASWHSLGAFIFAKMLGKPTVLVTGGYDVANVPEINYGFQQGGLSKLVTGIVFRLSDKILPVSSSALKETLKIRAVSEEKVVCVVHGIADHIVNTVQVEKRPIALTVSGINQVAAKRKGLFEFVRSAALLPEYQFILVGRATDDVIDELKALASTNVEFTGYLSETDLAQLRAEALVYVQASHHEGFGVAVAEAMLARCVPVVSTHGALPEVVGSTGISIDDTLPETIANGIRQASEKQSELGPKARARIIKRYPIQSRAEKIHRVIDQLLGLAD